MKKALILVVIAIAISSSAAAQPTKTAEPVQPESKTMLEPSRPEPPDPFSSLTNLPGFERSGPVKSVEKTSPTIAQLPAIPQDRVFADLDDVFGEKSSETAAFMNRNKALARDYQQARLDYGKLASYREKPLPKVLLWTLYGDAQLVKYSASGASDQYAAAGFNHLRSVVASVDADKEVNVTVATVDAKGKSIDGFQICYLPAEWADLQIVPLVFAKPSGSSETLPRTNWTFWSRVFGDEGKVGTPTTKNIDKELSLSIGIPPQ